MSRARLVLIAGLVGVALLCTSSVSEGQTCPQTDAHTFDCCEQTGSGDVPGILAVAPLFDCLETLSGVPLSDPRYFYWSAVADYRADSVDAGDRVAARFRARYDAAALTDEHSAV